MKLRNNDALSTVDDEGTVVGHQRDFTKENFLFFDVANSLSTRFILVVHGQANGDFEWSSVRHATLFALRHVILQLQSYGIAAAVTESNNVLIECSAMMAKYITGMEGVGADFRAAMTTNGAQVMQTLKVAALALPVAD